MKITLIIIGGIIIISAAVCGIFFAVMTIIKRRSGQNTDDQADDAIIAEGIKNNAAVFDGLYEGIFQAVRNREAFYHDAYEEWCTRANQIDSESFRASFAKKFSRQDIENEELCRKKMSSLLSYINLAEITRERENGKVYTADELMCCAYLTIEGNKPVEGKEYTVLKSAWMKNGSKVAEYGMVMPVSD